MKVLVTGGAGFIGSHHAEKLLMLVVDDAAVVQGLTLPGSIALDARVADVFGGRVEGEGGVLRALDHVVVYEQLPVGTDVGEALYAALCHVNVCLRFNWLEVTSYLECIGIIKGLLGGLGKHYGK